MHVSLLGKRFTALCCVLALLATWTSGLNTSAQDAPPSATASRPTADIASPATDDTGDPALDPAAVIQASETPGVPTPPVTPLHFTETGRPDTPAASEEVSQPFASVAPPATNEGALEPVKTDEQSDPAQADESYAGSTHDEKREGAASHHDDGAQHQTGDKHGEDDVHGGHHEAPSLLSAIPFGLILLAIAILPLIHSVEHWWHHNRNKLIVSAILATITLLYYLLRGTGFHAEPGLSSVKAVLEHAVLEEYVPFIVLLFSLYTISGGIQLRGDLKARPATNAVFLGLGALLASVIGTTGASMLLIRPVLQINQERRHVRHTVIFFIFLVSNIGGSLLPIGDPPLFLGYLFGVPFLWTLNLWMPWLFTVCVLLVVYWVWDTLAYRLETVEDRQRDATQIEPLRLRGSLNFLWLLCVVVAVATMVPDKELMGTSFVVPNYLREAVMLVFVGLAWITTPSRIRKENSFDFMAIIEVAALFIGIFITMQAPIEILNAKGAELGLARPWQFFWATGLLSSFLDNAPTYVVYFKTAGTLSPEGMEMMGNVNTLLKTIPIPLLIGVSLGAVFMGANTYIGNGPNFMVKSIAEQSGVRMPSFFGYMLYSVGVLIPIFLLVMVIFLL